MQPWPARRTAVAGLVGLLLGQSRTAARGAQPSGPELWRTGREFFFSVSPVQYEIMPTQEHPNVFGIATEWPIRGNVATVVAYSDGTSNLYLSSGYVVLGGFVARASAKRYISEAEAMFKDARKTEEHPVPRADEVRFYIRSFDSLYVIQDSLAALMNGQSKNDRLFSAANRVMAELFEAAEKAQAEGKAKR